ncbi:hypothetical protein MTO96_040988, partial [Rhipicephalus appendiculatus]
MFAGQPKSATKEQFLEQAKAARIERAQERRRDQAASIIQVCTFEMCTTLFW